MNLDLLLPQRLDWPSAIGNLLLNFGTLDYLVWGFLKDHLSAEEFGKVEEPLRPRLRKMRERMGRAPFPANRQIEFDQWLARLEPIRDLRNRVAHGHYYCRADPATGQVTLTVFTAKDLDTGSNPGARHVTLTELETALQALPVLIADFENLAG